MLKALGMILSVLLKCYINKLKLIHKVSVSFILVGPVLKPLLVSEREENLQQEIGMQCGAHGR